MHKKEPIAPRTGKVKQRDGSADRFVSAAMKDPCQESLVKICAGCRSICDKQGSWNHRATIESAHSSKLFSHGLCPACAQILYPEYYNKITLAPSGSRERHLEED